ncbi:hypothetical protein BJ546DRAFT_948728 [Cryomyces antarcticus]
MDYPITTSLHSYNLVTCAPGRQEASSSESRNMGDTPSSWPNTSDHVPPRPIKESQECEGSTEVGVNAARTVDIADISSSTTPDTVLLSADIWLTSASNSATSVGGEASTPTPVTTKDTGLPDPLITPVPVTLPNIPERFPRGRAVGSYLPQSNARVACRRSSISSESATTPFLPSSSTTYPSTATPPGPMDVRRDLQAWSSAPSLTASIRQNRVQPRPSTAMTCSSSTPYVVSMRAPAAPAAPTSTFQLHHAPTAPAPTPAHDCRIDGHRYRLLCLTSDLPVSATVGGVHTNAKLPPITWMPKRCSVAIIRSSVALPSMTLAQNRHGIHRRCHGGYTLEL